MHSPLRGREQVTMSRQGRRLDHWTTSLDIIEALRDRIASVASPEGDLVTRQLMAQVAHAKSSSFVALLDASGWVLDVNPAALITGGLDRAEVVGLPLWTTPWWTNGGSEAARMLSNAVAAAAAGRFTRFD